MSSLFGQPWWFDAVAPGAWGAAIVEHADRVVARLPWARTRMPVRGVTLTRLGSPILTPFVEPVLELGEGKPVTRLAREEKLIKALVDELPPYDYLSYTFPPAYASWLPFRWAGLDGTLRATYVIDRIDDLEAVWGGMADDRRGQIRKAEKALEVVEDDDAGRLAAASRSTFTRQGKTPPFDRGLFERVHDALRRREAGTILSAVDASGESHASLLLVWDGPRAYYLAGGSHESRLGSGAQSLLLWSAIQRSAGRSTTFDFEGSMLPGVARFFRGFGSAPVPYVQVVGASRRMRAALAMRDLARAFRST